jgi:hypothetical protein
MIFFQNRPKYAIFFIIQKLTKWPNHFISGKQFQKGQMTALSNLSLQKAGDRPQIT